jgi:hypothetical protein
VINASVAGAPFIAPLQQGRFFPARERNAVLNSYLTAISLVEKRAARIVSHGENELLAFLSFRAWLEDYTD